MEAGKLNRRITIQSRDSGTDDGGQPLQTWTTLTTVWAHVRGATGLATMRAGLEGVEVNGYSFRIRYNTAVDAAERIVYGGLNYDVKSVSHDHAGKVWTDIVAEVGGSDG